MELPKESLGIQKIAALHVSLGDFTPMRSPVFQFCGKTKRGSAVGPKRMADLYTVSALTKPWIAALIGKS